MPAPKAKVATNPANRLPHIGSYQRRLPVSLERMYENALDWEHLPWLHSDSFASLDIVDAGDWGWRADVVLQPIPSGAMGSTAEWQAALLKATRQTPLQTSRFLTQSIGQLIRSKRGQKIQIELRLDRQRQRWITRTIRGAGEGGEIWTHVFEREDKNGMAQIDIVVDFFLPGVPAALAPLLGRYYQGLYAQLYDEDQAMMVERQAQLDSKRGRKKAAEPLALGAIESLKAELPKVVQFGGRDWRLVLDNDQVKAHSTLCPHWLGPLSDANIEEGKVECPWHGYAFYLDTGAPVGEHQCKLPKPPKIQVDASSGLVSLIADVVKR